MRRALLNLSGGVACALAACARGPERAVYAGGTLRVTADSAVILATGRAGSAYLRIENRGPAPDTLRMVAIDSAHAMLHGTRADGEMRRMVMLGETPIPAGESLALAPGGTHIMFGNRTPPLAPGDTLLVTLTFARAGVLRIPLPVRALRLE